MTESARMRLAFLNRLLIACNRRWAVRSGAGWVDRLGVTLHREVDISSIRRVRPAISSRVRGLGESIWQAAAPHTRRMKAAGEDACPPKSIFGTEP